MAGWDVEPPQLKYEPQIEWGKDDSQWQDSSSSSSSNEANAVVPPATSLFAGLDIATPATRPHHFVRHRGRQSSTDSAQNPMYRRQSSGNYSLQQDMYRRRSSGRNSTMNPIYGTRSSPIIHSFDDYDRSTTLSSPHFIGSPITIKPKKPSLPGTPLSRSKSMKELLMRKNEDYTLAFAVSSAICASIVLGQESMEKKNNNSRSYKSSSSSKLGFTTPEPGDFKETVEVPVYNRDVEDLQCTDYSPTAFSALRSLFGISNKQYISSLGDIHGGVEGDGKSGQLFFVSDDQRFIIKTLSNAELDFLCSFLEDYFYHILANPDTLICRFFSLHTLYISKGKMSHFSSARHVVVMENAMVTDLTLEVKFDLKGSLQNRRVSEEEVEAGRVAVLKDLNLGRYRCRLQSKSMEFLFVQLQIDVAFLRRHSLMDYSLLFGVSQPVGGDIIKEAENGACSYASEHCFDSKEKRNIRRSRWQKFHGGILSAKGAPASRRPNLETLGSHEVYYLAIIDVLQQFNWRKLGENIVKTARHGEDAQISCVDPTTYASRFLKFMEKSVFVKEGTTR
eukprot:g4258.t1